MKKILLLLMVFGVFITQSLWAQNMTIKGQVFDTKSNEPLPGVTIIIKGTMTGTVTDGMGNYTIKANTGQTLVFSSIGFTTQEIKVGNNSVVNVKLEAANVMLDEAVVVSEFGMKRAARAVGAATQTVKGNEIVESGRENFINALQGRVSGMQITNSGGTPGSSSSVLIRGVTSISGSNQPLYVIDGIPMNNNTFNPIGGLASKAGTDPVASDRTLDFSNRGSDLNPDDIESITVLKGAAAAALYGSDASNGAIIITTKKGKIGKGQVSYSTYYRMDQAYRYPEMQTKYDNGMYGNTNYYSSRRYGQPYPAGTVLYDNLKNMFQTGITQKHTVSFEAGNEAMTFRAGASTIKQTGIVPTSDYSRNNLTVSGTSKLSKWMNIEANLTYAYADNNKVDKGSGGVLNRAMLWPLTDDMRVYTDPSGKIKYPNKYADVDILNPYFALYKNKNYDESNRFIANVVVNLTPFKNFLVRGQIGYDVSNSTFIIVRHPQWSPTATGTGSYDQSRINETYPTVNFISTYKKEFGKFTASAQIGYHQFEQSGKTLSVHGEKFMVTDFQSINNCDISTLINITRTTKRRLQAVSGSFEFAYKNMAFLTLRGRNDWSSTLPVENNSYFYPAVDASFVPTELGFFRKNLKVIDYLKLRASLTQVGKDAPPLSIYPALEAAATSYGGYRYGFTGPNLNLRPEINTAWETGLEGRMFRNRLNFDMAYYSTKSEDQIITGFRMSYATGFVLNNMNVGSFETSGVEMSVSGDIVKNKNWVVNVGVNAFRNWSKVVSLPENVSEYYNGYTWNSGNIRNGIKVGYPITSLTGNDYLRNNNGQVLIDPSTGFPLVSGVWSFLADREPDVNYGATASVRYKGFNLSAVIDGKIGSAVVNGTKRYMMQYGFSQESVLQRESAPVVFNGILRDGYENTETPTVNSIGVKLGDLQYGYSGADPDWIETGVNYLRLAELKLSYTLNKKWLEKTTKGIISSIQLYTLGSDLMFWTNYSGVDPVGNSNSAALGGTGGVGQDIFAIAAPRGLTFGLNVTF